MPSSSIALTFSTLGRAVLELGVNVVIAGVLEAIFPPYDKARGTPWLDLAEGTVEILGYVLLSGAVDSVLSPLVSSGEYAGVPFGSLAMFWLCEGALYKIGSFVRYISDTLNARRARFLTMRSVQPSVAPTTPGTVEHANAAE